MIKEVYAKINEAPIYKSFSDNKGDTLVNKVLLGTWLGVDKEDGNWYHVVTAGEDGWINRNDTTDNKELKVFFIDVGQGDAILIEVGDKKFIVDGGPNNNFYEYLIKWQYKYLITKSEPITIDGLFITHPDEDHYKGLIEIINNRLVHINSIYHNGIVRFSSEKEDRPTNFNTDLGEKSNSYLLNSYNGIDSINDLLSNKKQLQPAFRSFLEAIQNAYKANRIKNIQRVDMDFGEITFQVNNKDFKIKILGPALNKNATGNDVYKWFADSSHTRNGHSIVLKISYGNVSILLGGDLNKLSENHLIQSYGNSNPFNSDIAKSCHHGASDFEDNFMKLINAKATIISSGDNESYSHPRADAIGCAGKYSARQRPLVFSTELARSITKSGDILFGMINLRSDGEEIYLSQMKEKRTGANIWDSYKV